MVKIAIIGAGASGLAALKVSAADYGFDACCFDRSPDLGGLWNFKPNYKPGEASVMRSTITNTSKEMMAYSDFPPPADFPNYLPHRYVCEYFRSYARNFRLMNRVRFNTEIVSVQRADDHHKTGRWVVKFKNLQTGQITTDIFDAILACTGHHAEPFVPKFKGLGSNGQFKGRVLHSATYKDSKGYEDKNVIIVGAASSAADVAVELSRVREKLYLVARRGTWLRPRVYDNGYPFDISVINRFNATLANVFPNLAVAMAQYKANCRFDHQKYGLLPKHNICQQSIILNDELAGRIACGSVAVKPGIREFQSNNAVVFEDGTKVDNVDTVIMCTGYSFGFPYLENGSLVPVKDNWVNLYKNMYAPHLAHAQTLAVIGCCQVTGSLIPVSEMQARVACEHLKPDASIRLPTRSEMEIDFKRKSESINNRYVNSRCHRIQVDYIRYMDELSSIIGAKPSILKFLFTDPRLAASIYFGPCLPYQYRLRGPHAWPESRNAILKTWDRIWHPYKRLDSPQSQLGNLNLRATFRHALGRSWIGKALVGSTAALAIFVVAK